MPEIETSQSTPFVQPSSEEAVRRYIDGQITKAEYTEAIRHDTEKMQKSLGVRPLRDHKKRRFKRKLFR